MSEAASVDFTNPLPLTPNPRMQSTYDFKFDLYPDDLLNFYTQNQIDLLRIVKSGVLERMTFLYGSKGSGKTYASLEMWAMYVLSRPKEDTFLMCSKTLVSLERNCLTLLKKKFGAKNVRWSKANKQMLFFGRTIWIEGANDESSWQKIQGLSVAGAYIDELTNIPESFFVIVDGSCRVSEGEAEPKIIATMNPSSPKHWVKQNYINRRNELSLDVFFLGIDDNHFLSQETRENIKLNYTGIYYLRYILGKWAAAEGAIYDIFSSQKKKFLIKPDNINYSDIAFSTVGVDIGGTKSGSAFVHVGFSRNMASLVVLDEEYFKGENVTPSYLNNKFHEFYNRQVFKPNQVFFESAEPMLKNGLQRYCAAVVKKVVRKGSKIIREFEEQRIPGLKFWKSIKGAINDRIRFEQFLFGHERIKISTKCKELIEALETAVWNSKKPDVDERLDDGETCNIDILDAFEYAFEKFMRTIMLNNNNDSFFEDERHNKRVNKL